MDINATVKGLLEALLEGDRETSVILSEAIADWIDRLEGAMPQRDRILDDLQRVLESER